MVVAVEAILTVPVEFVVVVYAAMVELGLCVAMMETAIMDDV